MKKTIAVALLATSSSFTFADQDAGCGLGSALWAGQSGLLPKVLASFTNAWVFQSVSIAVGTFGCSRDGVVSSRVRVTMFTGSNADQLAKDMSVGHGETLSVLADLLGVPQHDKPVFFQATRENFGTIFAPANQTAGQVLDAIQQVMSQDARLAAYVIKA